MANVFCFEYCKISQYKNWTQDIPAPWHMISAFLSWTVNLYGLLQVLISWLQPLQMATLLTNHICKVVIMAYVRCFLPHCGPFWGSVPPCQTFVSGHWIPCKEDFHRGIMGCHQGAFHSWTEGRSSLATPTPTLPSSPLIRQEGFQPKQNCNSYQGHVLWS